MRKDSFLLQIYLSVQHYNTNTSHTADELCKAMFIPKKPLLGLQHRGALRQAHCPPRSREQQSIEIEGQKTV